MVYDVAMDITKEIHYEHIVEALRDAPTSSGPNTPSYTVFGPGGVSWSELADVISSLTREVSDLTKIVEQAAEDNIGSEQEYEYGHSDAYQLASHSRRSNIYWHGSLGGATAELEIWDRQNILKANHRQGKSKSFIVARVKAGSIFALDPEDEVMDPLGHQPF